MILCFSWLLIFSLCLLSARSLVILSSPSQDHTMEVSILVGHATLGLLPSGDQLKILLPCKFVMNHKRYTTIRLLVSFRFKLCRGRQFCSCWLAASWWIWSRSVSGVSQSCCVVSWGASLCCSQGYQFWPVTYLFI